MKTKLIIVLFLLSILGACTNEFDEPEVTYRPNPQPIIDESVTLLAPYADIRGGFAWLFPNGRAYRKNQYNVNDIITFEFNEWTILLGSEDIQARIMENGKNPGLGVRSLHAQGITGKGVNVAIIDQNLLLNHPEFAGKIISYYDTGCDQPENEGSMHAPAVVSLLVGDTIGTAPGAKVYFAAAPSWKGDTEYYARALYWIIEENKKLQAGDKSRVVSVSAAPSGQGSPFTKNLNMWDQAVLAAQQNGILVLDCRNDPKTGIIFPAFYDSADPENIAACTGGYPNSGKYRIPDSYIGVPNSRRTVAEEYHEGTPSYTYCGVGGLSWAIPYAAGVLALGWQVNPALNADQIVKILFDTRFILRDGSRIINPVAFIDAVQRTVK
jgi:subtilisin family serine protease